MYGKVTSPPKEKAQLFAPSESREASSHVPHPSGEGEYDVLIPAQKPSSGKIEDNDSVYDSVHETAPANLGRPRPEAFHTPPPSRPQVSRKPRSVSSPAEHIPVRQRVSQNEAPPPTKAKPPSPKTKPKVAHKPQKPSIEEFDEGRSSPVLTQRTRTPNPAPVPKPRRRVTASESGNSETKVKSLERMSVLEVSTSDPPDGRAQTLNRKSIMELEVRWKDQGVDPRRHRPHLPSPPGRPRSSTKPPSPDLARRLQGSSPELPPKIPHSPGPAVKPKPHPSVGPKPRQRAVTSHGTNAPNSPPPPTGHRPRNYSAMATDIPPLPPKPT